MANQIPSIIHLTTTMQMAQARKHLSRHKGQGQGKGKGKEASATSPKGGTSVSKSERDMRSNHTYLHVRSFLHLVDISIANKTPPTGALNAAVTPHATPIATKSLSSLL